MIATDRIKNIFVLVNYFLKSQVNLFEIHIFKWSLFQKNGQLLANLTQLFFPIISF